MSAGDAEQLTRRLPALHAATVAAAAGIVARPADGSFLEKTLRDGLAAQLPRATTEQPLNLDRGVWAGRLGGVDLLYTDEQTRIGVETKVWDVADSLYDIFKLAAGTQRETIAIGYCVIAGRTRDWRTPSAIHEMSQTPIGATAEWTTADVLRDRAGMGTDLEAHRDPADRDPGPAAHPSRGADRDAVGPRPPDPHHRSTGDRRGPPRPGRGRRGSRHHRSAYGSSGSHAAAAARRTLYARSVGERREQASNPQVAGSNPAGGA